MGNIKTEKHKTKSRTSGRWGIILALILPVWFALLLSPVGHIVGMGSIWLVIVVLFVIGCINVRVPSI